MASGAVGKEEVKRKVIEALKRAYDPEIPVNVYDLGLIYDVRVDDDGNVEIDMTLTAPGCPMAAMVASIVEAEVREAVGYDKDVKVNLVWDPPWDPRRVTPEGRKRLKEIFGYDVVEEWIRRYDEFRGQRK